MVWKSWGWRPVLSAALLLLLLCPGAAAAASDVSLTLTSAPPRISRSASALFAFRAVQSSGWTCGDCAITCKLDGGSASDCGGRSGNGTEVVSYGGLRDGNHTFAACATPAAGTAGPTCATYAWDVDTVPPTASVAAESAFTSASNVSVLVSFSEPCPGAGGFTCNASYCNLLVYGPGRVEASTLEEVVPGLRYSVTVTASPEAEYGRLILVMRRGFCTDVAGHHFRRTSNSSFTLRFDRRKDAMKISATIPEKLLQIEGATRVVEATNDERGLRIYLSFAEPVMNSSAEVLAALSATGAALTPTNRTTLGNRRFGYLVSRISDTAVVTVGCDASSIISRQGSPVYSPAEPFTFLYDTQRPSVKLATSTVRTSSHTIPVLVKFGKPVFNFSSSALQIPGGKLLSFHEASKSIYTVQIQAVDKLVSVQVAENTAQDVAGNLNLASDRLQVRHYSVPASSSSIATIVTVTFAATAAVATLLTVSTSSLIASGTITRPSSYSISEPSRNILRMACHIQIFALSRWLSINLPVEYYELAKGIEWTIPYIRLPWEGPSADPFVGYSTMPAIAYSELVDRIGVQADPYNPRAGQQQIMPMQIPADGAIPVPALDGKPLTAMEYRAFFENQDMKPEAQIIMKLQDLDGWKYFGRNMLWLGVIGGGLILLHLLLLLYLRLRFRGGAGSYGALVLPRFEIMLAILALPCISQASGALIRGGTTGGLAVGIVLIGVLAAFLVALFLFLSLGITTGRLLQYKEVHQEGQEHRWYQEIVRRTLGPGKRGQWTWKDPARGARLVKLGPLFEDLRGPPKYMLTQIVVGGGGGGKRAAADQRIMASEDENEDAEAPLLQKVFGILRIYYTLIESVKRVALGIVAGAHASSGRSSRAHAVVVLALASFQLFFVLLKKPFIKKRVQLVEIVAVASEVFVFAACLVLIDRDSGELEEVEESVGVGIAMLGVFSVAFAALVCNEWNALYRPPPTKTLNPSPTKPSLPPPSLPPPAAASATGSTYQTKMPLGQRAGDKSDSRYCGVEVLDFPAGDGLPAVLSHSLSSAFDFLLAPLVDPEYRPTPGAVLPVAASDLILSPSQWSSHIVGKISEWIDLDSEDEQLRLDSELTLKQEIAWASHLSLQACVLPPPRRSTCANYARVVNNILQGLTNMQLWLRIPLEKKESIDEDHVIVNNNHPMTDIVDSWEWWNSFRLLCEHSSQLYVALDIMSSLPSMNSLGRWFGEPVRAAILQTDAFLTNARGYPCLSKRHQTLLTGFFNHSVQVIISGRSNHNDSQVSEGVLGSDENHTEDTHTRHALSPYLDYIAYLYQRIDPLPEQERFEINYRDFLQSPLQPLMDNLEAQTYETFEKDTVKYTQYQRAIAKALVDKVPDNEVPTTRTVLMVVGAGRGPLVRASLQAAEETGRKLKVYAVEKNPNAVITLHSLIKLEGWESMVTIISSDMRCWDAPEKADILVSELLGSFGDNELSPECLDGAQRFLKPDGISIPSSYTSFIQPVTASKLHNDIKAHKDIAHFETAYVVKLHRVARLAPPQEVFSFSHPNFSPKATNERYTKLQFELPQDTGSCLVHGFAGYFDAVLYKDVHLGIEPNTCTPNMFSWFPIFFPLRKPIYVPSESPIDVHFWRCCAATKVWYEWALMAPSPSPIHNSNGRSYWVGL